MTPARDYKDVIGELTEAAEALRERDRARAAELRRRLAELHRELAGAEERAALARLGVELHWEAVLEVLWDEAWMTLRPHPQPDPRADPDRLDELQAAADRAAGAVREAVRRRVFGLR